MLTKQSTSALPGRLTQVAIYPHLHTYLTGDCGHSKLEFYSQYSREKCLMECACKAVMRICECRPPYFPEYNNYTACNFTRHSECISPKFILFNYTDCNRCPVECNKYSYIRNVEYGKYHEPIYRTLNQFSLTTGNQDIDIAAFQVLSEKIGV